jgi:hypothetical protein
MIKVGDYAIIDEYDENLLCKILSVGRPEQTTRSISVQILWPKTFGRKAYRIVIDLSKLKLLDKEQVKLVKSLYE